MLSIPKYPEQYAQHFPTIFYLLCCASQHHVCSCVFHLNWVLGGRGGASPKGFVHNLLMQCLTLGSLKIELSKTHFFDTMIT